MLAEIVDVLYHPAFEETVSVDQRHVMLYARQIWHFDDEVNGSDNVIGTVEIEDAY